MRIGVFGIVCDLRLGTLRDLQEQVKPGFKLAQVAIAGDAQHFKAFALDGLGQGRPVVPVMFAREVIAVGAVSVAISVTGSCGNTAALVIAMI